MKKNSKSIGILGGMGPSASVYLYRLLIEKSISNFGVQHNDEFPEILIYSIPVPDFISNNENKSEALRMLRDRVELINQTNISLLAIACNTAHVLLPQLQEVSSVPFISMIDEVVAAIKKDGLKKIGILATPSTLNSKLYQKVLAKQGIIPIQPEAKELLVLEKAIRNVIGEKISYKDSHCLIRVANKLKEQGAEGIVLGCTELPLVFPRKYSLPLYNSVEILAQSLLRDYYK